MKEITLKDIKHDTRNYRKHDKRNLDLIKKSIDEVGFGRSVVIDNNNEIIAGNGVVSQVDKDTKIKVVETDGSELVVVKRTDLATDDEKRKRLAIMDNSASDTSEFDIELLQADFDVPDLQDMGIDVPSIDFSYEEDALNEEKQINKKLLKCPVCGHINEEKAFKSYEDSE